MDPRLQMIIDDARAEHGEDPAVNTFSFQPAASPLAAYRYSSTPLGDLTSSARLGGSSQSPYAVPHNFQPVENPSRPVYGNQISIFDDEGGTYYNQPIHPLPSQHQSSIPGRLSLAPRNIYNQHQPEPPRPLSNAENHFRFTQNLRADLPVNGDLRRDPSPRVPTRNNDSIGQLLNAMGSNRALPLARFRPEEQNDFLQKGLLGTSSIFQQHNQQHTPPTMSNYAASPHTLLPSTDSSPYHVQESPSERISMRRASGTRVTPGSLQPPVRNKLEAKVFLPRTPQACIISPVKKTPQSETVAIPRNIPRTLALGHAPPMVHGIQLVSPHELPDRFRQVFPYQLFNAVQSKCFAPIYKSTNNVVVAAPTGSGKTALLELAICKAVEDNGSRQFKIVYQAPTKSLCSERVRDWSKKFTHLNLSCAELTGDTGQLEMTRVRNASIIVTTPEKWDSITRKWADHHKLVQMVKLFLIDEVHILKEVRGATLEAVVSRMKSMGANVRFVALSATIPNSEDVAVWLGRDHCTQQLPAHRETFDEAFRPVKLQKYVYGYDAKMNDFAFEKLLDGKLPGLIRKHTQKKPIMIFCFTRKSCENTASRLAEWWTGQSASERAWPSPTQRVIVRSKELQDLVACGVAFHHAGLEPQDRQDIETGYLKGIISVICCTSTLAVGVNLPCHLVILKGTVTFGNNLLTEYSDLEVMQMLGRAGRPQFEDTAVAVIMTKSDKKEHYEKMFSGTDILESSLHRNLIEHLNSEIGLQTVNSLDSAKSWLEGTFLSVRMRLNPGYYKIDNIAQGGDTDHRLKLVCERDIKLLQEHELITCGQTIKCTEYGQAMSRYMVNFETMKIILSIPEHAKTEEILNIICQASEFKELRMKPNQRPCLREINKSPFMKFPIKDAIATTTQKICLLVQMQLGGIEHPTEKEFAGMKRQFVTEKSIVSERISRLIRCVIDCKAVDCDAISTRYALDLARSVSAGYWENSNLQLRQIPNVGPVLARKFISNNINSIEKLSGLDTATIERYAGKNPPFGKKVQQDLLGFPRLTCTAELIGNHIKKIGKKPKVSVKVRLGYSNAKTPVWDGKKPSLTFLAETSHGVLVHFWRGGMHQLDRGLEIKFTAELSGVGDDITCRVACDAIIGTQYMRVLKHNIPACDFPPVPKSIVSKDKPSRKLSSDEFGLDDINDEELLDVASKADKVADEDGFYDVEDRLEAKSTTAASKKPSVTEHPLLQMANGKYACNHVCRDGQPLKNGLSCKHRCCKEGLDKPRKSRARISSGNVGQEQVQQKYDKSRTSNTTIKPGTGRSKGYTKKQNLKLKREFEFSDDEDMEVVDLAQDRPPTSYSDLAPRDYRKLHNLHNSIQEDTKALRLMSQKPQYQYGSGDPPQLPFALDTRSSEDLFDELDYEDEDFPSPSALLPGSRNNKITPAASCGVAPGSEDFMVEEFSHSGISHNEASDLFGEDTVFSAEQRPASSFDNSSMDSLEAGMLDLGEPMTEPVPDTENPKLNSSFVDGVFDFEAFNNGEDSQGSRLSLSAYQPAGLQPPTTKYTQQPMKRLRSPSPEEEVVKCRRIAKDHNVTHTPQEASEPPKPIYPEWLSEFDQDLIDEFKDIVDFID